MSVRFTRNSFSGSHRKCGRIRNWSRKIEAISEFPRPKSIRDVQSFTGAAGFWRKFIQDFSNTVEPLVRLTKKLVKFYGGDEEENAFREVIKALSMAPVLTRFDQKKPITLETDACDYGGRLFCVRKKELFSVRVDNWTKQRRNIPSRKRNVWR